MSILEFDPALAADNGFSSPLAEVTIRYRLPEDTVRRVTNYTCTYNSTDFKDLPSCHRFATSVVMFGGLLKKSKYYKNISWYDAINIASQSYNPKDPVQKEMIDLIEKAKRIYSKEKKRRKGDD